MEEGTRVKFELEKLPASPTIPMASPAARDERPQHNPAPRIA